ncbi:MAG: cbb3-type cytochrome c oxidase subunit I, partial [Bdellovibrionales bacterium]|nr:cbb3-type cytochrome c oxidase subunit I [Bdellovibrionales bacterium]
QRQLALFALLVVLLGLMLLSCVLIADVSKMMLDYFGSKHFHPFVFCCQFASAVLFLGLFLQIAPHIIAALISQTTHEGFVEFNWASLFEFLNGSMGYILLLPAMGVLSVIISDHTKKDFRFARLFTISISLLVVVGYFKFSIDYLEASFQLLNTIEQVALGLPPIVLMMAIIRNLRYPLKKKTTALYFAMMSIPMFSLGAISGIALLIPTFAHVAQDSSYAAAHLHYLLAPGALFTLIGGAYHYYPKIRGRALDDVLGKLHFWLSIIAINSVFLPMLVQGLFPLTDLSYLMFCASVALFMSQFLFIANIFKTEFSRQP